MKHYCCDLCGVDDPVAIPFTERYTRQRPLSTCRQCGLVYVPDRRSWEEIGLSYENGYYERNVYYQHLTEHIKRRSYKVVRFIESFASLDGRRLLDVGCGEGELIRFARMRGATVFGIDPSRSATEKARAKGLPVFTGTFEDYSQSNNSARFDFVVFDFVLETMESPSQILRKCRDLIADDGYLIVETGNRLNYQAYPFPLYRIIRDVPMELTPYRWSEATLEALLNVNGFKVVWKDWRWRDPQDLCFATQRCEPYPIECVSYDSYYRILWYFGMWHLWSYVLSPRDRGKDLLRRMYRMLKKRKPTT